MSNDSSDILLSEVQKQGYNILPQDLWRLLDLEVKTLVIDVRTELEWHEVGCPDLSHYGQKIHKISLFTAPKYELNSDFVTQVSELLAQFSDSHDVHLFFICRSGKRSEMARDLVKNKLSHSNAYNVLGGVEGESNNKILVGWLGNNLPISK